MSLARRSMLIVLALCLVWTSDAAAADKSATCGDLQSVLNLVATGDVITLDSSDGPNGRCPGGYTLPSFPPVGGGNPVVWQLQGNPSNGQDGFDMNGTGRALTGDDVHRLEIQNLLFRDGSVTGDGGAISVTGESSLAVRLSIFFNNSATGNGGAVSHVQSAFYGFGVGAFQANTFGSETDPNEGNTAGGNGGAVSVVTPGQGQNAGINTNLFANNEAVGNGGAFSWVLTPPGSENFSLDFNRVVSNRAGGSGGGGSVVVGNATLLRLDQELYEGNSVEPVPAEQQANPQTAQADALSHFGGGIYIESGGSQIIQRNNVFRANAVNEFVDGHDYGGGGEAIDGDSAAPEQPVFAQSQFDTFVNNTVAGQPLDAFESEGGGLFFTGTGARYQGWTDVVAGNDVGAGGEGGGAYAGADDGEATLEFSDSSVAGNTVGEGGSNAGLGGDGNDNLQLHNTIVHSALMPDIGGFDEIDVLYSDACQADDAVFPGAGNICTDPLLVDPAAGDIHQTKLSPTIDKGSDELFFDVAGEGPFTDFEGDDRPTDGDGDGHTTDMGADESPAVQPPPQPPPTPPSPAKAAQCSDGVDNDSDGAIDAQDPGCLSGVNSTFNPADANEGDEGLGDLVLCGRRKISLVRADARGRKVLLDGLVAARFAGQKVTIFANYGRGWKKLSTKKSNAAGAFKAKVPGPPARLFNKVRYQARLQKFRSIALKLPQSLASNSVREQGGDIVLKGKVKRSVLGKGNAVIIRRLVCGHYQKVGQAKPDRRGNYVVRFKAPKLAAAALYRAETTVLARPGSKRYVKQYARAIGITLSGATG